MARRYVVEYYDATAQRTTVHSEFEEKSEAVSAFHNLMFSVGYSEKGIDNFIRRHGALLEADSPDITLLDASNNANLIFRTIEK